MMIFRATSAFCLFALLACTVEPREPATDEAVPARPLEPWSQVEPMASKPLERSTVLTRIVFGSCLKQNDPMPVFDAMIAARPDLAVLLGDNVYGDIADLRDSNLSELVVAYQDLAARPEFARFREAVPVLTVWDDHDYGLNDAGGDFPRKFETEKVFENAWALPGDDPRRARDGVYTAETFGPEGQRVQVILLDTRFFRSALTPTNERGAPGKERYLPSADPGQTILGSEQEAWLGDVLKEPADLRILVSSIQVIAEGHGWEAWRTMPLARQRLYDTIEKSGVTNLVVVSGDRHLAGLYRDNDALPFPLVELTASSLNAPQSTRRAAQGDTSIEAGPKRLGDPVYVSNFGAMEIDWGTRTVALSVHDEEGAAVRTTAFAFGE